MKNLLLIVLLSLLSFKASNSQQNIWIDINENEITPVGNRYIIPDLYRIVELNHDNLNPLLRSAQMEFSQEAIDRSAIIELPLPDGTFQKFKFWESPTMEPELQAKFPEIRTYTGQGIDDPYATLKFDITPEGFHAQILSPDGRVFIDPYSMGDINNYISYYTRDYQKVNDDFHCKVLFDEYSIPEPENYSDNPRPPTGPQLRTYRLANAATGEYTAFHGGTVPLGLAAVTTSINRVNGVYEKEVAVRMVLVANNNLIIYTNALTDPYTNDNGSTMLGQNQSNLDAVIGTANYDIGHVFSTGGGGVAYLGCVCTSNKARGVTGSSTPIGDAFDIDYVAHEMGHQFGGNHSFNGDAGSCGGGNRNASTAYEPGSGSTIMCYAGICGSQDLQAHSDAYFHGISFDEIRLYTNSGSGNNCPVITNTGNSAPIVTVPSGGFYIPKSTPFALTGSATDPNNDPLTYCWEEFDLGPAGAPGTPSGNAPIFRSFNPTTSSTRTFPKLSDLLNNTQTIGEILPTYTRNLNFRLTARDNRVGGGGVDYSQMTTFFVDGNSGPFLVTSPNTTVSWLGNTQQTITWNVANTNSTPVSCVNVKILLSTNGGNTFDNVLLPSTPNDGSQVISLPNLPTSQARIKVEAVGNIFFDISNANFNIINNNVVNNPESFMATTVNSSQIDLTFNPNTNNNNIVIVWNLNGIFTVPTGTPPGVGQVFAGGILLYNGINSPVSHMGLTQLTTYYYKAFSYDGTYYSTGLTTNSTTLPLLDFGINLTIVDNCGNNTHTLIFGTGSGATDCYDVGFDLSAPPPPPVGAIDGRFLSCNDAFFTDIRGSNPSGERIWDINYQPNQGCSPMSLSWNPAILPATGYFHLVDPYLGTLVNVNMRTRNNYTDVTGLGNLQIKYNYQICSNFNISNGWNMISLPTGVVNNNYLTLFPDAMPGTLYGYNGTYVTTTNIQNGVGYWLKFPSAEFVEVCGTDIMESTLNLAAGWNMIGGPNCNVPMSSVIDPGGILIPGTLYGYSGSYSTSTSIDGTKGYWVKANAAGTITISCGNVVDKNEEVLSKIIKSTEEFGKIKISDGKNNNQTLYFKGKLDENLNIESFSMPPVPIAGSFDARFVGDYKLTESDEVTIQVQTSDYPIRFEVTNLKTNESYILTEIANGVDAATHKIANGTEIIINNKEATILRISKEQLIPTTYNLEQNYPNPFNPSTTIKFSLPEATIVRLTIYNALGQKVGEIVNTNLEAGWYSYQWDATNLATGIYVYELRTDKFVSVKKMILMK